MTDTVRVIDSFLILQALWILLLQKTPYEGNARKGMLEKYIMLHFMVERKGIVVDNIILECLMSICLNRIRPLSFSSG